MRLKLMVSTLLATTFGFTAVAIAGPASDSLGTCMIESLGSKDKKQLGQWIFFAMATHPDTKEYSRVPADIQKGTNEYVGKLVTQLLSESCAEKVKIAAREEGPDAIKTAFELVGKIAIQELMTNKEVSASIADYAKFVDNEKLGAVIKDK